MPNSSNFVDDNVEYITGAYCPLPSFGNESEIEVEYIMGAYCPLPGYENESEFVSESLSEEFNEALTPGSTETSLPAVQLSVNPVPRYAIFASDHRFQAAKSA